MLDESSARDALAPYARTLVDVVEGGWQRYLDEKIPRANPTTRANIVNDHMHDLMPVLLEDAERRVPSGRGARKDKPFYEIAGLCLRLKYLKNGVPANIATRTQDAVAAQLVLPGLAPTVPPPTPTVLYLDGLEPELVPPPSPPYVSIGYSLDPTESHIDDVLAVYQQDGEVLWSFDLRELVVTPAPAPTPAVGPATPAPALPAIAASGDSDASAATDIAKSS